MVSLRAESNQTAVVASLLARWNPSGAALSLCFSDFSSVLFSTVVYLSITSRRICHLRARAHSLVICLITKITFRYLIFSPPNPASKFDFLVPRARTVS